MGYVKYDLINSPINSIKYGHKDYKINIKSVFW